MGVRLALAVLRGYKVAISPYFRGSCRFLPTCADYAAIAIARHGFAYGSWLAARRLIRCHPLCAAGYDPVPLAPFRGPVRLRAWLSGVTTPKLVPIAGDGRREGLQHSK